MPDLGHQPRFSPLEQPMYDPFRELPGYKLGEAPWAGPIWSRLRNSVYPILELCIDAYFVSISKSFQGNVEFAHHIDAVNQFVCEGADVQVCDGASGGTCLHFAAGSGAIGVCRILLWAKALASARDRRLRTPLWWAIAGSHAEVCKWLLRHDEKIAKLVDIERMLPLHMAAAIGQPQIVTLLLPYCGLTGPDVPDKRLRTPLHVAAGQLQWKACMTLLEAKADPQAPCSRGKTALHYVAERGSDGLELCRYLVRCWPLTRRLRDASGRTPMELAAARCCLTRELKMTLRSPCGPRPGCGSTSRRAASLPMRARSKCKGKGKSSHHCVFGPVEWNSQPVRNQTQS